MAHHIYQTEGFVVSRINIKESDVLLSIFTKDLGLVSVQAKNLRSVTSKLRYQCSLFSHSQFSLVRGRQLWRLVGAESSDLKSPSLVNSEHYLKLAQVFSVLKFFIHGQEPHPELFDEVKEGVVFLSGLPAEETVLRYFEYLITLRLLKHLGYFKSDPMIDSVVLSKQWSFDILEDLKGQELVAIGTINQAFVESGL